MVKRNQQRFILLTCGVLLILAVLRCQITEPVWKQSEREISYKQQKYTDVITREELNDFIRLWPQFKELGMADDMIVSYRIDRPSKFIDWKTKVWFVYHRWDADRFFYVQQRLISLLHTLGARRNAQALLSQLEGRDDEISKSMIDLQKKRMNTGHDDEAELRMVEQKEKILKKMFE